MLLTLVAAAFGTYAAQATMVYQMPQTLNLSDATFSNPGQPWPRYYDAALVTFWRMGAEPFQVAAWPVGQYTSVPIENASTANQIGLPPATAPVPGQNTGSTVQFCDAGVCDSSISNSTGLFGAYLSTITNPPQAGQTLR